MSAVYFAMIILHKADHLTFEGGWGGRFGLSKNFFFRIEMLGKIFSQLNFVQDFFFLVMHPSVEYFFTLIFNLSFTSD